MGESIQDDNDEVEDEDDEEKQRKDGAEGEKKRKTDDDEFGKPAAPPGAQWSGSTKNQDVSTGPLARPFARSLAPLTRGKVYNLMFQFHLVLNHSGTSARTEAKTIMC